VVDVDGATAIVSIVDSRLCLWTGRILTKKTLALDWLRRVRLLRMARRNDSTIYLCKFDQDGSAFNEDEGVASDGGVALSSLNGKLAWVCSSRF